MNIHRYLLLLPVLLLNFGLSEAFDIDRWLEKVNSSIKTAQAVSEWKKEYGGVFIEASYETKTAAVTFSLEFNDDLMNLKNGETYNYYGVNNFRQIDLEKDFSSIWYVAKLLKIYSNGQQTSIPPNMIRNVIFIMDSKNSEIYDIMKIPEIRKEVKKKIFEYKPVEGYGQSKLYGLDPIREYEKIMYENN